MGVVIAFTECEQRDYVRVSCRSVLCEGCFSPNVSQTVDEEGAMLEEGGLQDTTDPETTPVISPEQSSNNTWHKIAQNESQSLIVFMLEANHRICLQVFHALHFRFPLEEQPSPMSEPESLCNIIWIFVRVRVPVMHSVIRAPTQNRSLEGRGTESEQHITNNRMSLIGSMREQTMITCSDT